MPSKPDVPKAVTLKAPAKINLHLGVHDELDERRYHRVDSIMCAVALYDVVTVSPADALSVGMDVDCGVDPEHNTCYQAALKMGERFGREPRVRISVEKRIPAQSGLGGSSSDAAAVLLGLCELWGIDPADPAVAATARSVGADVPFFLDPRPTLLVGAGDVLAEAFRPLKPLPVVLVRPPAGVSTVEAYRSFDQFPTVPRDIDAMCEALREGDALGVCAYLENNLADAACRLAPGCQEALDWLRVRPGVIACQVTGSGSCVFGLCRTRADAERAASNVRNAKDWWALATTTI